MDYKYIEQLLERYWLCETTLEEEQILRTFFSQESVPVRLLPYKDLFTYEQASVETEKLGDDFDRRMLEMVGEVPPVKAKKISMTQRLRPLFKAAAIVAIILTLGNAIQVAIQSREQAPIANNGGYNTPGNGPSVAITDTLKGDSRKIAESLKGDSMKIAETPIIK